MISPRMQLQLSRCTWAHFRHESLCPRLPSSRRLNSSEETCMSVAMKDLPRRHGITVDEFIRMYEAGELAPDARVELIEGEIIDMPLPGSRHSSMDMRVNALLMRAVGDQAMVRPGGGVRLDDMSLVGPDFALVVPREDFYEYHHPTPEETFLAIEVSDSRLSFDLGRKRALYARRG